MNSFCCCYLPSRDGLLALCVCKYSSKMNYSATFQQKQWKKKYPLPFYPIFPNCYRKQKIFSCLPHLCGLKIIINLSRSRFCGTVYKTVTRRTVETITYRNPKERFRLKNAVKLIVRNVFL